QHDVLLGTDEESMGCAPGTATRGGKGRSRGRRCPSPPPWRRPALPYKVRICSASVKSFTRREMSQFELEIFYCVYCDSTLGCQRWRRSRKVCTRHGRVCEP